MQGSKQTETSQIPSRHCFLTGSGKFVSPKDAQAFCDELVNGCLDGKEALKMCEFVLGFAACFDAISRGTVDFDRSAIEVARQAYRDINNVTTTPNKVTDIMRIEG